LSLLVAITVWISQEKKILLVYEAMKETLVGYWLQKS
jgi:hypothetical protein